MPSIFSRIIAGEIPGVFVWRDELCVAFMSINPIADGHTLVVPLDEVDHWIDCGDDLAAHLFHVTHVIGRAQQQAFGCERVGVIVAGFEVPHTHVHVIPTHDMSDLSFANAKVSVTRDELDAAAERIRTALSEAGRTEVVR
jgi:diadenosine tetraphosphate (Ap4A) HIT family hydrolase